MRGDLIFGILEILESMVFATADLFDVFTSSYSEAYRKARKLMLYGPSSRKSIIEPLRESQRFYNLLYHLQKEGLIKKKNKGKTSWLITKKGKEKLRKLKEQQKDFIPKKTYNLEKGDDLKIVIFDIPEKYREKRDWLRWVLLNLNFKMLQKSVWIGQNKLPQDFIKDLKELNILQYIEIFSVNKTGTIKQLK
jgi:hypothetical protein